jgi:spore maturation protein CgeB
MRIVFVGQLGRGQTSRMRADALTRLGHEVHAVDSGGIWSDHGYIRRLAEQRLGRGGSIDRFNMRVQAALAAARPQLLWAEKQEYLDPAILHHCSRVGVRTFHYNPDPYFSLSWKRTRCADQCLPLYDVLVVTKRYELDSYRDYCSGVVVYSPLGYDPIAHVPEVRAMQRAPESDVSFVGGWEPRREALLMAARGLACRVRVWGYGWALAQRPRWDPRRFIRLGRLDPESRVYLGPIARDLRSSVMPGEGLHGEIYGNMYAHAVGSSAVTLGLLRKVCPDQHTTRTFEIPAMSGFMLADRTDDHLEFFDEGIEAEYFSSDDEYIDKVEFYLSRPDARRRIAHAGHDRCRRSDYSYDARIRQVLASAGIEASRWL